MIPIVPSLIALALVFLANFLRNVRKYPKGPMPLPLIGNLYQIKDPMKLNLQLIEWSRIYGNVFTVYLPHPIVVVMSYEGMKEALVTKGDDLSGRTNEFPDNMFMRVPNGGVVFSDGDDWVLQRRTAVQILKEFGMGKNVMEQKVVLSVNEFTNYIDSLEDKSAVDLHWPVQLMIANVINQILYGWHYKYDNFESLRHFVEVFFQVSVDVHSSKLTLLMMTFPWIRHIPILGYLAYFRHLDTIKALHDHTDKNITKCLETFNEENEPECMVHAYNQKLVKGNEPGLTREQMHNTSQDFFIAGMESTTCTIRFGILFMTAYPEIQEKARQEILSVIGKDRMVTMADKLLLPYTYAIVHETMRRGNVVRVNLFHRARRETTLMDHPIPKDSVVLSQIDSIHRTDPLFEDPDAFRPERFLLEDGKTMNKAAIDRVVPFSMGKRQCAGADIARVEMFIGIATILQKYRILPAEGQKLDLEPIWGAFLIPQNFLYKLEDV